MCIIVIISVLAFFRKRPVKIPLESSVNNVLRMLCHFLITSIHGSDRARRESKMNKLVIDLGFNACSKLAVKGEVL